LEIVEFALLAISSTVAVMEPFSTIAVYATLTENMDSKKKRRIIARSMRISTLVLMFFAFTGNVLFLVFNITVSAFQIAGGILLIAVAIRMLNPTQSGYSPEGSQDIAIVLLAFPLTQVLVRLRQSYSWFPKQAVSTSLLLFSWEYLWEF